MYQCDNRPILLLKVLVLIWMILFCGIGSNDEELLRSPDFSINTNDYQNSRVYAFSFVQEKNIALKVLTIYIQLCTIETIMWIRKVMKCFEIQHTSNPICFHRLIFLINRFIFYSIFCPTQHNPSLFQLKTSILVELLPTFLIFLFNFLFNPLFFFYPNPTFFILCSIICPTQYFIHILFFPNQYFFFVST